MTIEEAIIRAAMFLSGLVVGHVFGWAAHRRQTRRQRRRLHTRRWKTAVVPSAELVAFVTANEVDQTPNRVGESDMWLVDYRANGEDENK